MLDKVKYINHKNETILFGEDGIVINKNDLRDYSWNYNSQYSKITSFSRSTTKKKIPYVIYGSRSEANRIFEIFEKDVLAGIAGKLYIGDYYIRGYIFASTKTDYLGDVIKGTLQFVTDSNTWIKSVTYLYRLNDVKNQEGLGYEYDFPYDYTSKVNTQDMNNTSFVESDFILNVYGQVNDPVVTIAGHDYHVEVDLASNEYLTINSHDKTIIKTDGRGNKINVFANRDLDSYIFQKLPTGESKIVTSSDFNFDITLLMERSEPEWT